MKYKRIVVGVDQSYENTGISVAADGKLRDIKSVPLGQCKTHSKKRRVLNKCLVSLLSHVTQLSDEVVVICEAARLHGGPTSFININAIKAMGALTATIVDVADMYGIKVYSVDTRCWKSQVVGTSKPLNNKFGVPPEKWPTVQWVLDQGFSNKVRIQLPEKSRKSKGTYIGCDGNKYMYNNDACDSAGIAMFGFIGDPDKLHEER